MDDPSVGAKIGNDVTVKCIVYVDGNDGIVAVEYHDGSLTPDQLGAVFSNLLRDTLGDEPNMRDVFAIQRTMAQALQPAKA